MGGFFGAVSKENCAADVFYGTDYHSHLGTVRGGMAFYANGVFHRAIHDISNSPFRTRFDSDYVAFCNVEPKSGIGVISDTDDQPLLFFSHLGRYAIVTVGHIYNIDEIVADLVRNRSVNFAAMQGAGVSQTELVALLINTQATIPEGLKYVQEVIKGSCSVLILAEGDVLYASRDKFGRTPITIGGKPDSYAATFESCSLPNLGYEIAKELGPGEIVRMTAEGVETLCEPGPVMALCSFLFVYYGYPASSYSGKNVEHVRYHCGEYLARNNPVEADIVAGIPDSGVGHALGYARESHIRYARPYVKYTPTWPRSFTPTEQKKRQHIAQMKLIPVPDLIRNHRIVFCDDSIVRGTQLRDQVQRLYKEGANEVHIRIACPPLLYPCKFINFSRSRDIMDLATRRIIRDFDGENADVAAYRDPQGEPYRNMVERLRERLGIDSLAFQSIDDLKEAISLSGICTYCWTGEDPSMPGSCSGGCTKCPQACSARAE